MKKLKKYDRLYAIGDIHGCFDELNILYQFLVNNEKINQNDRLIFLGDYIDRGPKSRETLVLLCQIKKDYPQTVFLRGNHEDMLLDLLGFGGRYGPMSFANGSVKFFQDYRITKNRIKIDSHTHEGHFDQYTPLSKVISNIDSDHLEFLKTTEEKVRTNNILFVHAGYNPWKKWKFQNTEDFFWIRHDFINYANRDNKFKKLNHIGLCVIHGHTIVSDVVFDLPARICIDTGCYFNTKTKDNKGFLSCLQVNENNLIKSKIIQVPSGTVQVKVKT